MKRQLMQLTLANGVPVGLIIGESGLEEQLFRKMMPEVPLFPQKNLWDVMQSK